MRKQNVPPFWDLFRHHTRKGEDGGLAASKISILSNKNIPLVGTALEPPPPPRNPLSGYGGLDFI